MVKSVAPVFILLFAVLFRLETFNYKTMWAIITICVGVGITVANETKFDSYGYFLIQMATIISGLRWALTQILLKGSESAVDNPFATSMFVSPVVATALFVWSLLVEDWYTLFSGPHFNSFLDGAFLLFSITIGGCVAFLMVNIEFQLICTTSAMTLSVAGLFKELVTIMAGVFVFGDVLTINILLGLIISLIGIFGK
jgi:solute carrier family 35, member C2